MAVFFGAMTCYGVSWLRNFNISATAFTISDGPNLCRRSETTLDDHTFYLDDVYLCSLKHDEDGKFIELSDTEDYVFYLNNQITFASGINSAQLKVVLCVIGSISTVASLMGAIIYWNHNRSR